MKVLAFQQLPYRHLPAGFENHHDSIVTTPYHELVEPAQMHADHLAFLDELMHAARSGFDGVALTEHSQASYDVVPNPNLHLAALAYATAREGLPTALCGVGRSLGKSREPLRIAEEYAMVDQLSGGRVIAGFPVALSYDANINAGIPPIETRARFAENRELIERAWTSREVFAFNGRFNRHPKVNLWPRPYQSPRPPIWSPAVGNPNTLAGILDNDDVFLYFSWFGPKRTGARIFDRYWDMAVEKGRDPNPYRMAFMQCVAVAETDAIAHREMEQHIVNGFRTANGSIPPQCLGLPGYIDIRGVEFLAKDPGDLGIAAQMRHISYRELVESGAIIVGSPATVREKLLELVKTFRIGNLLLMGQHGSMPSAMAQRTTTLLASEVLPALKQVWAGQDWEHRWWPKTAVGHPGVPA